MNEVAGEIVTLVRGEARRRGRSPFQAELVSSLPADRRGPGVLAAGHAESDAERMDAMDQLEARDTRGWSSARGGCDENVEVAVSEADGGDRAEDHGGRGASLDPLETDAKGARHEAGDRSHRRGARDRGLGQIARPSRRKEPPTFTRQVPEQKTARGKSSTRTPHGRSQEAAVRTKVR